MAAARYWRLVGIETYAGGDLELSALQLNTAGGRVDQLATLTCSHAPSAGLLTALQDADPATTVRFAAADVRAAGFWLQWDFGATAQDVVSVTIGAGAAESTWPESMDVSSSSDGVSWTMAGNVYGALYQDSNTLALIIGGYQRIRWSDLGSSASTLNAEQTLYTSSSYTGSAARANASISSGKHYWELLLQQVNTSPYGNSLNFGVWPLSRPISTYIYNTSGVYRAYQQCAQGDVFGFEFDADAGVLRVYRNGALVATISGLPVSAAEPWAPVVGDDNSGGAKVLANFKGPFVFAPSAGYKAVDSVEGLGQRLVRSLRSNFAIAASAPVPAHTTASAPRLQMARDVAFGGQGTIYGTTKTAGTQGVPSTPTKARVVLLHQRSKLPVRETWSDPVTGNYAFVGIDTSQQFLVLAEDAAGNFRPVAANRLTPEVQP